MNMPNLDEETKEAINALTLDQIKHYAFSHNLLWYGIKGLGHAFFFLKAESSASIDEVCKEFGLEQSGTKLTTLDYPLQSLEHQGIFIPQQAYLNERGEPSEREIWLFNPDDLNALQLLINEGRKNECEYAITLYRKSIKPGWKIEEISDPNIIRQGIQWGRHVFDCSLRNFERTAVKGVIIGYDDEREPIYGQPLDPVVADLGRKLMNYYNQIINQPTTSTR